MELVDCAVVDEMNLLECFFQTDNSAEGVWLGLAAEFGLEGVVFVMWVWLVGVADWGVGAADSLNQVHPCSKLRIG